MIAILFRVKDSDDGWHGIAVGKNMKELFWQIDEHVDPSACEYKRITSHSICFKTEPCQDEEGNIIPSTDSETEFSESFYQDINSSKGWKDFAVSYDQVLDYGTDVSQ